MTGTAVVTASFIKSPAEAAASHVPPARDVLTAPVEQRVLTNSVVVRGLVTASQTVEVQAPASADGARPVVTKVAVHPGQALHAGQLLAEVSGRPVFVLAGQFPAYRDLKPGGHGPDVTQLQQALQKLGHDTGTDHSGVFGPGTQTAIAHLYEALGYDPVPAEADGEQQVAAAEAALTEAKRSLQDAKDALKQAQHPSAGTAADPEQVKQARTQVQRDLEDLTTAHKTLTAAQQAAGPQLPSSEVVFLDKFPARVESVAAVLGGAATGKLMTVSAGDLEIRGALAAYQKDLVHSGESVRILSEVAQITVEGKVASVADQPAAVTDPNGSSPGDGQAAATAAAPGTYQFTVHPDRALPAAFAGQDVRLTVQAASSQGKVLVVPVSAVSAAGDGRTLVTVYRGGQRRQVEVALGTLGDGYTEVRPIAAGALKPGDQVIVGVRSDGPVPGTQPDGQTP